jgi:carbamoyl-phosphate synthase large subunit
MARRTDLKRILIIGAGPIIIGQACEFDYSGTQACRALLEEGYEVILVNSNPATIMTDPNMATHTYIEPITPEIVTAIIDKERPDAILPTMGGQTALNIAFQLHETGVLEKYNVELIGANFASIRAAEDREVFKSVVLGVGLENLRSETVSCQEEAVVVAKNLGFPLIIRPAFTLGGSGGSIVYTESELHQAVEAGLGFSPINQILMEESALGWKEYEFEVMRDAKDNVVIVCSVENVDPMGVHTGDSITVAPAMTLSDKEYHLLRNASINIIRSVGVDAGGCNIQFAVHPKTGRIVVIEMNPRVSRSSALVSKATGVPIAKISAKLAIGLTLDEIPNDITHNTPACFEPAIDYVVTKIPRFSFEKFPGSNPELSPQMKSVGEVMAIGCTFQESLQKALRGLEVGLHGFTFPPSGLSKAEILEKLPRPSADRIRWIYYALHEGIAIAEIYRLTGIDPWFLENFREIIEMEKEIHQAKDGMPSDVLLKSAKVHGFGDMQMALLLSKSRQEVTTQRKEAGIFPVFKSVDTCAGEFEAYTPYFYGTYDGQENEAPAPNPEKKRVIILGGGPNRIGQGIEFDYCCVHAAFTLKQLGYDAIMVNSNPETVSTDYDISDRLYFEPLYPEHVMAILRQEQPMGVIAQLGGQTPLKLAHTLRNEDIPILGTSIESIDLAEDRDKFGQVMVKLGLRSPEFGIARSEAEALAVAKDIGYPLIARPSYILGGQSMRIFYNEASLKEYLAEVIQVQPDFPVLIDRFLEEAREIDVDAVSDGKETFIGGILQHIEHAGVHSGDSACVWPAQSLSEEMIQEITETTGKLAVALGIKGLLNIQFAIKDNELYVLEVNPRASRTVPFVCKATGFPLIQMATRIMLGESLATVKPDFEAPRHVAVKVPVFPFNKFKDTDPKLGPEMRSTGEVMGIDSSFPMAFAKAHVAAGNKLPLSGQVFISVNNYDKPQALEVARFYQKLGFSLVATTGTAAYLQSHGLTVTAIQKKHEGSPHAEELIAEGAVHLIINTPIGEEALTDDSYIRKAAITHNIPSTTTLTGAMAIAQAIAALQNQGFNVRSLQSYLSSEQRENAFSDMLNA